MPIVRDERNTTGKKRPGTRLAILCLLLLPFLLLAVAVAIPFLGYVRVAVGGKVLGVRGYHSTKARLFPAGWHTRSGKNPAGGFWTLNVRQGQVLYSVEWADAGTYQELPSGFPWD